MVSDRDVSVGFIGPKGRLSRHLAPFGTVGYKSHMKRAKAGKRGTPTERSLAILGTFMWVAWVLLNGFAPFSLIFGFVGVLMSISEYRRWQRRERYPSGRWDDRFVFPRWAWFAAGAVPSWFVVGFAYGFVLGMTGEPVDAGSPLIVFLGLVPWIAGGLATERLLVRAAERREEAERSALPTMPPPPPGGPPSAGDATNEADPRQPSNEPQVGPGPDRKQDPRARF